MRVLPYRNLTLHSPLTTTEVCRRLAEILDPPRFGTIAYRMTDVKPYHGSLRGTVFKINRSIRGRNITPDIIGDIEQGEDVTTSLISVKLRLDKTTIVFVGIWCSIVLFAAVMVIFQAATMPDGKVELGTFIPIGVPVAVYLMIFSAFTSESDRIISDLTKLFDATIKAQ